MWMTDLRTLFLRALLLDWLGQFLILALIISLPALTGIDIGFDSLRGQGSWLIFVFGFTLCLGGFSVVIPFFVGVDYLFPVLLQRLFHYFFRHPYGCGDRSLAFLTLVMTYGLFIEGPTLWIGVLSFWALLVRVCLRQGVAS